MKKVILSLLLAVSAFAAEELKVGVILPLSLNMASFGKSSLAGAQLRVKEINAAGKFKITLIIIDNKGGIAETKAAFKKLTSIDRVVAVIGPITSTNTLALQRVSKKAKTPIISPTATNDKVAPGSPYIFRSCFNDSFQGLIVATYAIKNMKYTKAAIVTDMGSDYSKGLSESFKKSFIAGGGKIVSEQKYQNTDTEFNAQLIKIKDSGAQVIFVPGVPPGLPLIIKQAGTMGLKASFCGADGWDSDAVLQNSGSKIVGSFIVGAFSAEDTRPIVKNFLKALPNAGSFEALGYDAISMLAEALKTGTKRSDIVLGLHAIKGLDAVTGSITVDAKGDSIKSAVILEIIKGEKKGKIVYEKKYISTVKP
ncbi:MAG: ABC transporter substrate-binding protein [Lentisphaeria bacterium]|nr:ABC transporter substrate-binding protein [Lentisphaeria bacterium]NQZ67252.1 ABC transporter substrate-binding protein [Lentisphaeria bacterium]